MNPFVNAVWHEVLKPDWEPAKPISWWELAIIAFVAISSVVLAVWLEYPSP